MRDNDVLLRNNKELIKEKAALVKERDDLKKSVTQLSRAKRISESKSGKESDRLQTLEKTTIALNKEVGELRETLAHEKAAHLRLMRQQKQSSQLRDSNSDKDSERMKTLEPTIIPLNKEVQVLRETLTREKASHKQSVDHKDALIVKLKAGQQSNSSADGNNGSSSVTDGAAASGNNAVEDDTSASSAMASASSTTPIASGAST